MVHCWGAEGYCIARSNLSAGVLSSFVSILHLGCLAQFSQSPIIGAETEPEASRLLMPQSIKAIHYLRVHFTQ